MQIKKAVITAAGRGVRLFPAADTVQKGMLPLVDRDGLAKPTLQIIAEEALDSGIEEVCVVCAPGDEARYVQQLKRLRLAAGIVNGDPVGALAGGHRQQPGTEPDHVAEGAVQLGRLHGGQGLVQDAASCQAAGIDLEHSAD